MEMMVGPSNLDETFSVLLRMEGKQPGRQSNSKGSFTSMGDLGFAFHVRKKENVNLGNISLTRQKVRFDVLQRR